MARFTLKQGYDVPIAGDSNPEVVDGALATVASVRPADFIGIKPRLLVRDGDSVLAGTPLFHAKDDESQVFTSPISGTVSEVSGVVRGDRRVLLAVNIESDGKNEAVSFEPTSAAAIPGKSSEQLRETLVKSGQLALFRERPFGHVARAKHTPRDIFVSAIASAPLAPDPAVLVEGNEEYFQAGIDACAKLTLGAVHLSVPGTGSVCSAFSGAKNCQIHEFSGPHPAGVVGVQIHHIAPVRSRQDIVWTITVQGLIQLGKLFVLGRVSPEKIVSVAGTSALDRRYFRTINGAPLQNVIRGQVADETIRYISGDVLTGTDIGAEGFVGLYDDMVTLIPESIDSEFVGWMQPGFRKHSMFRTYVSPWLPKQKHRLDTKVWGGHRALFASDAYGKVLPMKMFPLFLVKSCMIQDIDEMVGLGIYEVTEEEMALCEYVCPSKTPVQKIIREGLEFLYAEA